MADLKWYACVYETGRAIVYGRAPEGGAEDILDGIKQSLVFHDLIGIRSKVFLKDKRFRPGAVVDYCEEQAEKDRGDYRDFKVVKLDLRGTPEDKNLPGSK